MDPSSSLPVKAEDWTDSRSISSEDGYSGDVVMGRSPSPPSWINHATSDMQNGQLSPVSPGMDLSSLDTSSSTAPPMIHSASSSDWDITPYGDQDDGEHGWERRSSEIKVPKLEPQEDDFGGLGDAKDAPARAGQGDPKAKRPRGRPRKHPVAPTVSTNKVTKGRSKTGCITCRKRKKKCDEAKPRCMNCEKNAVVCEGYHEKQIWKSGKERAEEERMRRESLPMITMQPIFHGVETSEDKIFWKHYCITLSNVLTVEGEAKNAFKDIVLQLATRHQGLMHSILALSSKHIDYDTPYGAKLLQDNLDISLESLNQRSNYHQEEAMKRFYDDIQKPEDKDDPEYKTVLSARYGQMLCLLLQTLAEGNPRGEHRVHLRAYKTLIQHSPPEDPVFLTFITEFFQYHIYADELIWHPISGHKRLASEEWIPPRVLSPPRLLGVADGLFSYLSQITTIRNNIRENMRLNTDPIVDFGTLYQASEIDTALRAWMPQWPPGDSRDKVCLLYKQMMWVYLFRTIYPPCHTPHIELPSQPPSMLDPPQVHVEPHPEHPASNPSSPVQQHRTGSSSLNPSRTNSLHEADLPGTPSRSDSSSPPPIRRPAQHDGRITLAVNESLAIIESFKPSDPSQTILLIPCLVIGTSCFDPVQQDRVRVGVKCVKGYTGLRNCDCVLQVLEEVWRLMALGEWVKVWDWQGVAHEIGLDFLCT